MLMLRTAALVPRLRLAPALARRTFTSYNAAVAGLTPEQAEVSPRASDSSRGGMLGPWW